MGFKQTPSRLAVVSSFFNNLPRRLSGRPVPSRPHDAEICAPIHQSYITTALTYVADRVVEIHQMGAECSKLAMCLAGKDVSSLYITCANCSGGKTSSSDASAGSIQLCLDAFGVTLTQSTVNGLVLRELIRMCGGMELDVWGFDAYFTYVNHQPGATYYSNVPDYVKQYMCTGSIAGTEMNATYRAGKFLVWNPGAGKLWPKQLIGTGWAALDTYPLITNTAGNSAWTYTC